MFLALAIVSLALAIFLPTAIWYIYWYKFKNDLKNIPGPTPVPLIGHALKFKKSSIFLSTIINLIEKHGPLIRLAIGFEHSITIASYEILELVLSSTKLTHKASPYRHFQNWLGQGLLTSGGEKWRKRRKIITPAYHFKILEEFVKVFDNVGRVLVEELGKECEKTQTVDVYPFVTLCALDIICETAMGTSVNAQIKKDSEYVLSVKEMCRIIMDRTFSPWQQFEFLYKFSDNYRKELKCLKVLNEYTFSVIRKRRQELSSKQLEEEESNFGRRKIAFLDLLLQAKIDGEPLSDEDIREEVATFMFEGHDTTASAMSFALFEISKSPKIQQKLLEEQLEIFGKDRARDTTYKDLSEMKYLEMVIKETLRLYPSVPFYARQTHEDVKLNEEITLPKGLIINIFAYGIHRNPRYFPEPETFNPDRFAAENYTGKLPYSFIPFSAGMRNCIGQKFAMLEMKSTISKVLRHFVLGPLEPAHRIELISETILKSANGMLVKLQKRET